MVDASKSNKEGGWERHIVAVVDLLGQSQLLEDEQLAKLDETYDEVSRFRELFQEIFKNLGNKILNQRDKNFAKKEKNCMVGAMPSMQAFSDLIAVYGPIEEVSVLESLFTITTMLMSCAGVMLMEYSAGTFFRGGIEIGLGKEFPEGGIYGPVLNAAYRLERDIASYPRVVVGDKLAEYIMKICVDEKCKDLRGQIKNRLSRICKDFVTTDVDGWNIIDFLGKGVAEYYHPEMTEQHQERISRSLKRIDKEIENARNKRDIKLLWRYRMLRDYFDARTEYWGLGVED